MNVLDTDTPTHLFAGHPRVLARQALVPSSEIAITIITRIEALLGRFDFLLKAASGKELLRANPGWIRPCARWPGSKRYSSSSPPQPRSSTGCGRTRS